MAGTNSLQIRPIQGLAAQLAQYGQNLFNPPSNTIRNIEPSGWYSPLQPVEPMGPKDIEPRGFQYWWGQNLTWTPRFDAEYSAAQLRSLMTYPLARICAENVKDTICKASWEIQPRPKPGEPRKAAAKRGIGDEQLLKLNKFFEKPDRENVWPDWLRPLLDDMLSIDAATVIVRRTRNGQIVELPTMRGEMIVRYIDENGFTPMPPQPAYAQNWWGIPLCNLTTDQCIYKPRNIAPRNTVSSMLYGMSPTEVAAPWIEIGIERLAFILAYYREGSVPGVIQVVPSNIAPDKIAEAMQWMNSELAGNLAARRQWRMVQGFNEPGKSDQIIFSKEPLLADLYDDVHMRQIAFAYGTSPQRLAKAMNRASAQQADEASDIEGMLPYFAWLKNSVIDHIIRRKFGYENYEMVFDTGAEPNPEKQSVILTTFVKTATLTPNEAREKMGEEPRPEPEADQLGVVTGSGFVPLGSQGVGLQPGEDKPSGQLPAAQQSGKKPEGASGEEGSGEGAEAVGGKQPAGPRKPASANKSNGHKLALEGHAQIEAREIGFAAGINALPANPNPPLGYFVEMTKAGTRGFVSPPRIDPSHSLPETLKAKGLFERALAKQFKTMRRRTIKSLASSIGLSHGHLAKADDDEQREALRQVLDSLAADWDAIADDAAAYLADSSLAGAANGSVQLEISDEGMLGEINEVAADWARARGAELVGMKWDDAGNLIENPDARWAITETTRERLRDIIKNLFEAESASLRDVESAIDNAGIFSDVRASLIARNEVSRAQAQGNLAAWRESKLVKSVKVVLSADHDHVDECDDAEAGGPYPMDDVPDFPLHVNCLCSLVISGLAESVQ